jgi:hypothetical protein
VTEATFVNLSQYVKRSRTKKHEECKPTLDRRSSLFVIGLLVWLGLNGCSGGALTTRERVQELELLEVRVLENLLGLRLDVLVLELLLAESWGSVLEPWSVISCKVKKISISSNSNKSKRIKAEVERPTDRAAADETPT